MWGGWKLSCTSLLPWADNTGRKPCPTTCVYSIILLPRLHTELHRRSPVQKGTAQLHPSSNRRCCHYDSNRRDKREDPTRKKRESDLSNLLLDGLVLTCRDSPPEKIPRELLLCSGRLYRTRRVLRRRSRARDVGGGWRQGLEYQVSLRATMGKSSSCLPEHQ